MIDWLIDSPLHQSQAQCHLGVYAVARLVKDVFESAAGQDAVGAVSDYLRSQRVTSLTDLQVSFPL